MEIVFADKRLEKKQKGYSAAFEPSATAGAWEYEIRDPQGSHLLHGVFVGSKNDLLAMLRKIIKRNNGLFGIGAGWSWVATADACKEGLTQ